MKIAFFSSEVFPFAKTGGLADVSGSLPKSLVKENCEVKIFMPFYKNIKPEKTYDEFAVTHLADNLEVIFIRNDEYFFRDHLYTTEKGDYPDNLERFSFFCKKIFDIIKKINFSPQIFHANDWQTSLVNIYLKILYKNDKFFKGAKSVLTIHNLAYQGIFPKEKFSVLGIDEKYFSPQYLEFYGKINLLKGGIVFSDMVNTVSPTYSRQIQTKEFGCGLEGVLREKSFRLWGILNGIDTEVWDPQKDNFIYKKYSKSSLKDKFVNKKELQKELGLKIGDDFFLLGIVTRLAEQKGIDILIKALDKILDKYQLVLLGTGDRVYHEVLEKKRKDREKVFSLNLKFDEVLAHKIYAGCDAFLLPSRFEPCGLSQMISYRYGTPPIVHHTGGLKDTVEDYSKGGGGFVFAEYHPSALMEAIEKAESVFKDKQKWLSLLAKIMEYDFSWRKTAKEYIRMYKECLSLG